MKYHVKVLTYLKDGVLDTQGKAVARSLTGAGHTSLLNCRVGKYIQLWIEAESAESAYREAERMCDEVLVNELIEDFSIEVDEGQ
jgi:phosphoribosylformylglycinamidine synthase PurS subunit